MESDGGSNWTNEAREPDSKDAIAMDDIGSKLEMAQLEKYVLQNDNGYVIAPKTTRLASPHSNREVPSQLSIYSTG